MLFGFLTCLDSFLYSFTVLPLRFLMALVTIARSAVIKKCVVCSTSQKIDIIKFLVIAITVYLLTSLNASVIYHNIRGQSAVKLYVMFSVLEVGDKLCCSFGQDVLAVLLANKTLNGPIWKLYVFGSVAVGYNLLHSAALFCQMIALNVAVNSYSNALLTLLLSNQFGEIKSTVFKKFERENLFQLTCADISERFQLWAMLLIIGLRNVVEVSGSTGGVIPQSWKGWNTFVGALLGPAIVVLGSEIAVDWLKHSYIAKFNKLRPRVYSRFLDVFCADHVRSADIKNIRTSWGSKEMNVTRRIGVPVFPLTCIFIKSMMQLVQLISSKRQFTLPTRTSPRMKQTPVIEAANQTSGANFVEIVSAGVGSVIENSAFGSILLLIFFALVGFKLALGLGLLEYSTRRLERQRLKENTAAVVQFEDRFFDERVSGERKGGAWGLVDMGDGMREMINKNADTDSVPSTPLSPVSGVSSSASSVHGEPARPRRAVELQDVERFQMVAKRIW